jgi:hypothetical protein
LLGVLYFNISKAFQFFREKIEKDNAYLLFTCLKRSYGMNQLITFTTGFNVWNVSC